jgi:hypothetical protein
MKKMTHKVLVMMIMKKKETSLVSKEEENVEELEYDRRAGLKGSLIF